MPSRPLLPHAASGIVAELGHWPGSPSLAVVGEERMLASCDTGLVYRLASVTKLLTALTILSAAHDGVVSLDDPAGPHGSTLRHLLAHASGLSFAEERLQATVGSRRIYSNAGIDLAAAFLSGRSGRAFEEEMRARVLGPLGMARTALQGPPSKGGSAPMSDLARLAGELLNPQALPPSLIKEMSTVAFPGLAGFLPGFGHHGENPWGLGAEVRGAKQPHWTSPRNSRRTFGHFGMAGGFLWVDPDAKVACAALSTIGFGEWSTRVWPTISTAVLEAYAPQTGDRADTAHRPSCQESPVRIQEDPRGPEEGLRGFPVQTE